MNYKKAFLINQILVKIIRKINNIQFKILRNKFRQWIIARKKLKGEFVKKRIVKWTEEKYRISNARKNWKKLADLNDLYLQKKQKKYLINKLFSKYKIIIIFKYTNAKTETTALKYYLNKWKNKIKEIEEIEERDLKLEKLINKIDRFQEYNLLKHYLKIWFSIANKIKNNEYEKIISELKKNLEEYKKISNKDDIINLLISKDKEIKELKEIISRYPFKLSKGEKLISIIFNSSDQKIQYSIICKNTDIFNQIINLLFNQFPNYREGGNYFVCNGKIVNEYQTLEKNGIKNGDIIILNQY